MIVEIERQEGSYVESEHEIMVKTVGEQARIETVQTLDDDNRALGEAELMPLPLTLSALKVKGGELDLLAIKECS